MANKPEFVDLISDATRQNWRRTNRAADASKTALSKDKVQKKRLSSWPPARFAQWRLENLTPWKMTLKSWTFKDWV